MFDCMCFHWKRIADFSPPRPETFSLPAPMPQWPRGQGFGTGKITLGEIEVVKITKFEFIWIYNLQDRKKGVAFYKPIGIPDGFCSLGHYCQFNDQPLRGFALVAREIAFREPQNSSIWNRDHSPALLKPLDYTLIWSSDNGIERNLGGCGYFWLPQPPEGVPLGTFFCSSHWDSEEELNIACLKNLSPALHAMPSLDQIHALIRHYGPMVFFHPDEHSGGEWVDAFNLEFIEGNKAIVYSSKNGHASFPHPGSYIQGSAKLGIGIRNDATRSNHYVDSSNRYEIIAAEYLGNGVDSEPCWLQYMRKWGPTVVYDSRAELDKIINRLPLIIRYSVENMFDKFPVELYGEDGPTGPKEKDNWVGDERS
ncbi:vacuolar sorting-associated protein [Actinidia rufa]|uniref:Vacuolar sorting-associated protein n=1 Tax=Actinidia rufa TaxID=165716 RepID=A0A7J0H3P4_9ERIC|nr:vacuolar sorting-associated protein [Actinidia rufa]